MATYAALAMTIDDSKEASGLRWQSFVWKTANFAL